MEREISTIRSLGRKKSKSRLAGRKKKEALCSAKYRI